MYRRNITVYSATLAVFTIECDFEETNGPDMLLSFHSGDHYNSVRVNAGNSKKLSKSSSKSSRKLSRHSSGGSSRRSLGDTVTTASTISASPPESFQDNNIVVATVVGVDDVPTNVKKREPCPCGSGKKYKKCCMANVKEETKDDRRRKGRGSHDDLTGGFKVLQI